MDITFKLENSAGFDRHTKIIKKKSSKMAVAAVIASFGVAAQAGVLIDDFSTPQTTLSDTTNNGTGFSSTQNGGGIIGLNRDLFVEKTGGPGASGVHLGVWAAEIRVVTNNEV